MPRRLRPATNFALLAVAGWLTTGCASVPSGCICEQGRRQSPIDLGDAVAAELPPLEFDYAEAVRGEVFDTGTTVEVAFEGADRPVLRIGEERFELLQLHFHEPSEHRIAGSSFSLELHLVHANEVGELAVVGVFLEAAGGEPHPVIERIWATVPERPGDRAPIEIALRELLPANRGYYRYAGSLTTPPCSEGVRWHVLRGRLAVSPGQVAAYRYPESARAAQPGGGRPVLVGRVPPAGP